jgi:hypothetical protein
MAPTDGSLAVEVIIDGFKHAAHSGERLKDLINRQLGLRKHVHGCQRHDHYRAGRDFELQEPLGNRRLAQSPFNGTKLGCKN